MEIIISENKNWTRISHRNRMYMMVVDPRTLFAYWEVSEVTERLLSEHFECQWVDLPLFLILRDVTDLKDDGLNTPIIRQERITLENDHWYFHHLVPHRRYVLDLSTTTFHGQFFLLLRSNVVETPPLPSGTPRTPNFEWSFSPAIELHFSPTETSNAQKGSTTSEDHPKRDDGQPPVASPLQLVPYHHEFDGYSLIDRRTKA